MAKYEVTFSCGHTETKQLVGKDADRQRKIKYWEENEICSHCYAEQQNAKNAQGATETEMSYAEYKNNFADCKTKKDSYNAKTKTIIVYVPVVEEIEAEEVSEEVIETAIEEVAAILGEGTIQLATTMVKLGSVKLAEKFDNQKRLSPRLKEQAAEILEVMKKYKL